MAQPAPPPIEELRVTIKADDMEKGMKVIRKLKQVLKEVQGNRKKSLTFLKRRSTLARTSETFPTL